MSGLIGCSLLCTHRDMGGWKWMPFGAGSQWLVSSGSPLGGCPNAFANARPKPSTDS